MTIDKRDYRLDVLRALAILMLVLIHSPMPESVPGSVLSGISSHTAPLNFFLIPSITSTNTVALIIDRTRG